MTTECPKCKQTSGNDWSQCNKSCPMRCSPYYCSVAAKQARLADEFGSSATATNNGESKQ